MQRDFIHTTFNCMKTKFIKDKKQDKVRSLNYWFKKGTRRIYSTFAFMCDATEDRPAYQITTEDGSHSNTDVFEKIENASTLWRKEKDW